MRLALLLALSTSCLAAAAQPIAFSPEPESGFFLGISGGYAGLHTPTQTIGGGVLTGESVHGVHVGGLLGFELLRGLALTARPSYTRLLPEGESVQLYAGTIGLRARFPTAADPVDPYVEVGYGVIGRFGADDAPTYTDRGFTFGGGFAYLPDGSSGLVLDVRLTPFTVDAGVEQKLVRIGIGYVGFLN